MASLGTPESLSLQLPNTRISKGAQSQCPKKGDGTTIYSTPHTHAHPNQDIPNTTKLPPARPLARTAGHAGYTMSS